MKEQLYKKYNGEYSKIFPLNYIQNIIDNESGNTLISIIQAFNNIYIPYQNNSQDTRNIIPEYLRRKGLWITYNNGEEYITEYYKGDANDIQKYWSEDYNWEIIPNLKYVQDNASKLPDGIITPEKLSPALQELIKQNNIITNLPDDEDLEERNGVLSLKNRKYNSILASGKGYKILRKNWTKINGKTINLLTQDMINDINTIYEIRYDFDLNNTKIIIPEGCILKFKGGTLNSGTIDFNNCFIKSTETNILNDISIVGNIINTSVFTIWFDNNNTEESIQKAIDIIKQAAYNSSDPKYEVNCTHGVVYEINNSIYLYPGIDFNGRGCTFQAKSGLNTDYLLKVSIDKTSGGIIEEWNENITYIHGITFNNFLSGSNSNAKGISFSTYVEIYDLRFKNYTVCIANAGNYIDGISIHDINMYLIGEGYPINIYQGDRTRIYRINSNHKHCIKLGQCHGGRIENCIGIGVIAENCNSLTVSNIHNESPKSYFSFVSSVVTMSDCVLMEHNNTDPIIRVSSAYSNSSQVILNNICIYRGAESAIENINNISYNTITIDSISKVYFNNCFSDYQNLAGIGYIGNNLVPFVNNICLDINTINGIYENGKFNRFYRTISDKDKVELQDLRINDTIDSTINGECTYKVQYILNSLRNLGINSTITKTITTSNKAINIKMLHWGSGYSNNITVRLLRECNLGKHYIDIPFMGTCNGNFPFIDNGTYLSCIGKWTQVEKFPNIISCKRGFIGYNGDSEFFLETSTVPIFNINDCTIHTNNMVYNSSTKNTNIKNNYNGGEINALTRFFKQAITNEWDRKSVTINLNGIYVYGNKSVDIDIVIPTGTSPIPYIKSINGTNDINVKLYYLIKDSYIYLFINPDKNIVFSTQIIKHSADISNIDINYVVEDDILEEDLTLFLSYPSIGVFNDKPKKDYIYKGFQYYCTDKHSPENTNNGLMIYHIGNNTWVDSLGRIVNDNYPIKISGTTEERPTGIVEGFEYYDSTLKKKILWNGTNWVNLDGSSLL